LGLDSALGSIEVGKLADLIVYDPASNPLTSIVNSQTVQLVSKAGRVWEAATLNQILPTTQTLPPGPPLNTPTIGQ